MAAAVRAAATRGANSLLPRERFGPYWSVTRYNDIMTVELDHATYSSQLGGIQVEDQPADMKRGSFIRMDPPRHTAQRKTVAPVAAPVNLASYEVTIRERTRSVLDALPRNEAFDWVDKVSIELTTMMLATLFDFPWGRANLLVDVAICNVAAPDAPVHSEQERFAELLRMADVFKGLWQERAKTPPRLDLISMMAHSQGTSDMPEMEFVGNLALLIVGGNDTTRNSMSGGCRALRKSGRARQAQGRPRSCGEPRRRDDPLPDPGHSHAPHRHARRRACRGADPPGRQGRNVAFRATATRA